MAALLADGRDAQRVLLVALGERDDRPRHGRREEQGAALRRRRVEDLLEILAKAHVEHLVGLVEHDDLELRQVERAAFEMVAQPPRRADDDMGALRERAPLLHRVHAADAGRDPRAGLGVEPGELAADLQRQLAGRGDDQASGSRGEGRRRRRAAAAPWRGRRRPSCPSRSGPRRSGRALRFGLEDGGLDGGGRAEKHSRAPRLDDLEAEAAGEVVGEAGRAHLGMEGPPVAITRAGASAVRLPKPRRKRPSAWSTSRDGMAERARPRPWRIRPSAWRRSAAPSRRRRAGRASFRARRCGGARPGDEVRRRVAGERRDGEMRVGGEEAVGRGVEVGEIAAAAARDQDLLARPVGMVEEEHAAAALPGGGG
jgi:hypothetical protein